MPAGVAGLTPAATVAPVTAAASPTNMNLCKVGNQTSSVDPQAVNARVFVGNLNTFQVTKTDVEKVFQRYGRIAGISMHKGFAFVQFTGPFDARSSCLGEDGRTICGQVIDVNMVGEPKPHQQGKGGNPKAQKRPREESPADDCGSVKNGRLSVDSEGQPVSQQSMKKGKNDSNASASPIPREPFDLAQLKAYDNHDTLICGNCKEMFHNLSDIIDHKKHYCKLRFTCKCAPKISGSENDGRDSGLGSEVVLLCSSCNESFLHPWDLLVHVQKTHSLNIFDEAVDGLMPSEMIMQKEASAMMTIG